MRMRVVDGWGKLICGGMGYLWKLLKVVIRTTFYALSNGASGFQLAKWEYEKINFFGGKSNQF